jgi:hypothetical protein
LEPWLSNFYLCTTTKLIELCILSHVLKPTPKDFARNLNTCKNQSSCIYVCKTFRTINAAHLIYRNVHYTTLLAKISLQCENINQIRLTSEAGLQWLTSIILFTWEAEIRRMTVRGQPWQTLYETPSPNN